MMRRLVLVPLGVCALGLAVAAGDAAAQAGGGSITGQVLVRDRANGEHSLLVTVQNKGAPLEGAAILARECGDEARRRGVPADVIQ